ncbi:MAG: DUF898 family protein [Desulfobacterales bacterium]|nr:DUF898 family protein [Desulfobacterales bacterium]
MSTGKCDFRGTGGQYFAAVFIHLFLISTVTFGIYIPWAWVRLFKLKASHTVIRGRPVQFKGTGGQLLLLSLVNGLLIMITLGIYCPWAICKIIEWKTRNTLVEGKPSRFNGTGASLFVFFLIHLMILPLLTLGIYYFWGMFRFYAWKEENSEYGGEKTSFGAGFGGFLKVCILTWIMNTITLGLFTPWSMCMFYRWRISGLVVGDGEEIEHFPPVKTNYIILVILLLIGLSLLITICLNVKDRFDPQVKEAGKSIQVMPMKTGEVTGSQAIRLPVVKPPVLSAAKPVEKPVATDLPRKETRAYDQEIKILDDLIKRDANNEAALYNRARLYALKGKPNQALEGYTRVIKINDKHEDAYFNRGLVYVDMKQYGPAVKDFSKVITMSPNAFDAYCNRGNAYYQMGKKKLAIKDYTDALKIDPNDADVYHNRSVIYLSMGEKEKAGADSEKAGKLVEERKIETPQKPGTEKVSGPPAPLNAGSAVWREKLENVEIPGTSARGIIHGEEFIPDSVKLKNNILTIRDGKDFFPDHAVMIFLFLKDNETVEGKSYNITKTGGSGSPHVHMKWKPENSAVPESEMFVQDYVMRLDFGTIKNGRLPGKIYLCLPDDMRSFVAGGFSAIME